MYVVVSSLSSASSAIVLPAMLASIQMLPPALPASCAAAQRSEPAWVPPLVFVTLTVTHAPARAAAFGERVDGLVGATGSSTQATSAARPSRWRASGRRP